MIFMNKINKKNKFLILLEGMFKNSNEEYIVSLKKLIKFNSSEKKSFYFT